MGMKIIFCDVDGVLNSAYYTAKDGGGICAVEKRKVDNLKKIIDATGASVVICSRAHSWSKSLNELRMNDIINFGVTPFASITDIEYQESKALAIQRWMRKNNYENVNFVVFDDCASDLAMRFGERFIHIKTKHGLTSAYVKKAIEILNRGE